MRKGDGNGCGVSEQGVIGVDMGGTRLRVAAFDAAGTARVHMVRPTPRDDPSALAAAMTEAITDAHFEIAGAVVGVPGIVDYEAGTIVALPQLPAWGKAVSAAALMDMLGIPVTLANDADLAAVGEHRWGAGRGVRHMVYITCSTGIGAGVIVDGRLLHTRYSLAEVGHTVIDWRSGDWAERIGSGSGVERVTGEPAVTVAARAAEGDTEAARVIAEMAEAFSVAALTMVRCFMPERVVIGGGVSSIGEALFAPVRKRLVDAPYSLMTADAIVPAMFGDDAGLRGAYAYWQQLQEHN
jgi:glucokinase